MLQLHVKWPRDLALSCQSLAEGTAPGWVTTLAMEMDRVPGRWECWHVDDEIGVLEPPKPLLMRRIDTEVARLRSARAVIATVRRTLSTVFPGRINAHSLPWPIHYVK